MRQIRVIGWRRGLRKVEMTKAIRGHTRLNLAEAKACTDAVLNGQVVTLQVPTELAAELLLKELIEFGALAEQVVDGS